MNKLPEFLLLFLFITIIGVNGQTQYQSATIGFYNVENLFDIYPSVDVVNKALSHDNPNYRVSMPEDEAKALLNSLKSGKNDSASHRLYIDYQFNNEEFTPNGPKNFTETQFQTKIGNLSQVISQLGTNISKNAPVVLGMVEVENRQVIEELIHHPLLEPYHYEIVHFNSDDFRGIDVALIYQKGRFVVNESETYSVTLPPEPDGDVYTTRDILRVSGLLDDENFSFFVNHWPSRRGGEKASEPKREAAASVLKKAIEKVQSKNPNEKIIAMGDFNDDPTSPSISKVLNVEGNKKLLKKNALYSPMVKMYKNGEGTLAYRDSWNLFDLLIFSDNLVNDKIGKYYKMYKTSIFSPRYLISKEGQFKGYPRRTFGGDNFDTQGYSDHFPVYTVLLREL